MRSRRTARSLLAVRAGSSTRTCRSQEASRDDNRTSHADAADRWSDTTPATIWLYVTPVTRRRDCDYATERASRCWTSVFAVAAAPWPSIGCCLLRTGAAQPRHVDLLLAVAPRGAPSCSWHDAECWSRMTARGVLWPARTRTGRVLAWVARVPWRVICSRGHATWVMLHYAALPSRIAGSVLEGRMLSEMRSSYMREGVPRYVRRADVQRLQLRAAVVAICRRVPAPRGLRP